MEESLAWTFQMQKRNNFFFQYFFQTKREKNIFDAIKRTEALKPSKEKEKRGKWF